MTGAIFARGSCRALKWMALFGVVFALGAAQAAAQITITTPKTVDEGERLTLSVSAKISVGPGHTAASNIVITPTVAARTTDGSGVDLTAAEVAEGLTVAETTGVGQDYDAPVPAAWTLIVQPHPTGGTAAAVSRTLTGTITIQTRPDLDAQDEGIHLTYAVTGGTTDITNQGAQALALAPNQDAKNVTIKDTDDQVFEWELKTDSPKENAAIEVTLTADPTPVDRSYVTAIRVDKEGYRVDRTSFTFDATEDTAGVDGPMTTIMITPPDPDGDRDMDTIMLSAVMGGTNIDRTEPLEIEVADIHGLPMADDITAKAYMDDDGDKGDDEAMSVMEGGDPVHVTVTVDRGEKGYPSGEGLEVTISADGSQALDYRVEPTEIDIASGTGKKSATFKLWALVDDDIGMEDLMLHLTAKGAKAKDNGPGEVMSMFSIPIEDTSTPLVSVKDDAYDTIMTALGDDPLNPGDEVKIMTDDLFMHDADMVNVSFAASVEGGAVGASASGEAVTVMAMNPGEAKVTVTATATPMSSSLIATQDRANVAQLTFSVSVVMSDLSLTVTADPMEIEEGGMSTITAMASREVAEADGEVKVDLEVIGDGELSADSITIAAGEMMGTATVTAMEDDEDYEDETLTVVARGAGEATLTIMVTDNDEMPVPPEPTNVITAKSSDDIAAVLMAAGLGDDDMFNPGMMAMVDASMLFDVMEGYSASYSAESDDMAAASTSVSGSMVTVTAGTAGHAHIVITGTATMASGIEIVSGQPATNVATVLFSVNVTDTALEITVSTDPMDMVEEGGMITVTATANRDVVAADGTVEVMLTITGAVEMNEATIAIAAGSTGSAMVQVLDDMEVAPMADITIVATGSGIAAAQTFTISVTENDSARTFTLAGPDNMNLVEGMEYELTVTADPAVSADTEVMIMRDRSASTADDSDYMVENITIMAGEASGSTMLMVTEDEMDDSGAHMNEVLVLFATADNTQTNSLEFNLWDAAVPALPVIAQLLLAAFLAIGGYRRYLRR